MHLRDQLQYLFGDILRSDLHDCKSAVFRLRKVADTDEVWVHLFEPLRKFERLGQLDVRRQRLTVAEARRDKREQHRVLVRGDAGLRYQFACSTRAMSAFRCLAENYLNMQNVRKLAVQVLASGSASSLSRNVCEAYDASDVHSIRRETHPINLSNNQHGFVEPLAFL